MNAGCPAEGTRVDSGAWRVPVAFLTEWQRATCGRYVDEPTDEQLARFFHLDDEDKALIDRRRADHLRLGLALQLATDPFLGMFLSDLTDVPEAAVAYVGGQLGIDGPVVLLPRYLDRPAVHREHASEIRRWRGLRSSGRPPSACD